MNFSDIYNWFLPLIKKTVRKEIENNMPFKAYLGTVDSIFAGKINVLLVGDSTPITGIVNKTGESLTIGDRVWVWAIGGNLGNSIVAFRLEDDVT